jgi:hypothetical protein
MGTTVKAFETTGTVDEERRLVLDEPLPIPGNSRVRVIILLHDDEEPGEREWLRAAAANPAFDFLNDAGEDIYQPTDGKPFHDER